VIAGIGSPNTTSPIEPITAQKILDRFSDEDYENVTKFIASPKKS
jgi:hypothetical protein